MTRRNEDLTTIADRPADARRGSRRNRIALAVCGALACATSSGCLDSDAWLIDPSVVGRWEHTPTVVPVLERIDVIERDTGEFVDVTPVMAEDLIPEPTDYRTAPGDVIEIEILDFILPGAIAPYQRVVNSRGFIDLPQLGALNVRGLTREQIEQLIRESIIDAQIIEDPLVTVQIPGRRQATFSIFGAITGVGRYAIPSPDYRLLEALTDAGGVSPTIPKVFIIRQVTLTDEDLGAPPPIMPDGQPDDAQEDEGRDLLELIDELTEPQGDEGSNQGVLPNPSVFSDDDLYQSHEHRDRPRLPASVASMSMQEGDGNGTPPPIDLPDAEAPVTPRAPIGPAQAPEIATGRWVFINGEWIQVISGGPEPGADGLPEGEDPLAAAASGPLVTQRVIAVPVKPLLQGIARYNIVVRAGDVISVPGPEQGLVHVGGPGIARPGVYSIPATGKLTLQRLVFSAGGLSAIAIPQRVDLTRMVGEDRQATIRVNLRAIFAGTQPDIVIKPDDLVNIGTNFWATPLAVIRGGFRMSYGFGFLLDRNFGNDVFGAPPTNIGNR